jgi:biopolymer transport protein ExbD
MKLRRVRQPRRGRIEIIPMIDVMFFLLATFMLASLSMQNLNSLPVDLPKGTAERAQPVAPATMTVTHENQIYLNKKPVTLANLTETLQGLLRQQHQTSLIVAADESSKQGVVVQAMLAARRAGIEHFLIAIQPK